MNRVVETLYRLRDGTTAVLKRITRGYRENATTAESTSQRVEAANRRHSRSISGVLASIGKLRFAYFAVAGAIAGAVRGVGRMAKAASDQENAERRLEQIMRDVVGATDEEIQALKELAAERQKVTRFGDEQTISAQAMLGTFQLTAEQIEQLTPRMQDLAEGSRKLGQENVSLEQSAIIVGKALSGNAGELSRYGIVLSEAQKETLRFGTQQEKVAALSEALDANFKGLSESLTPYEQGVQGAKNAMGDLWEAIGAGITQTPQISKALGDMIGWFERLIEAVKEAAPAIQGFFGTTVAVLQGFAATIGGIYNTILLGANRLTRGVLQTARKLIDGLSKVTFGEAKERLEGFVADIDANLAKLEKSSEKRWDNMGRHTANWLTAGQDVINIITGQTEAQNEANEATRDGADAARDQVDAEEERAAALERTQKILDRLNVDTEKATTGIGTAAKQAAEDILFLATEGDQALGVLQAAVENAVKAFDAKEVEFFQQQLDKAYSAGKIAKEEYIGMTNALRGFTAETKKAETDFERLNNAIAEANGHDLTNIASEVRKLGEEGKLSADEIEKLKAAIEAKRQAQLAANREQQQGTKTTQEGTKALGKYAKGQDDAKGRAVRLGGAIHLAAEAQALFNQRLQEWQGGGTAQYIQFWKRSLEEAIEVNERMQAAEARLQRLRERGVEVNEVTEASNRELRFELMKLQGQKERIAEIEERDRRRAIEVQLDLARASGDEEQVRLLNERLRLMDQIAREEEKQARERERERKRKEREQRQQQGGGASTPPPVRAGGAPERRIQIDLNAIGGDANAPRMNTQDLRDLSRLVLRELESDMQRVGR